MRISRKPAGNDELIAHTQGYLHGSGRPFAARYLPSLDSECISVLEYKVSTACPGDESTWKAADWHWDSRAFVAAPKDGLQDTSICCKKRKTEKLSDVPDSFAGSCGGCQAAELAPLKILQQPDNSTGSNRSANDLLGSSVPKVRWLLLPFQHDFDQAVPLETQAVPLEPGSAHICPAFEKSLGLMLCQQLWPSVAI